MKKLFYIFFIALFISSCTEKSPAGENKKPTIVCTTSIIGDAIKNIVPAGVEVISLMGSGVDPHLYKATQGDLQKLQKADVIVYNGLHLEGKMGDILQKMSKTHRVICLGDAFDTAELLHPDGDEQAHDPHFWFDLTMWAKAVKHAKTELQTIYPGWAEDLDTKFFAYEQELLATHNWAKNTLATIPQNQRVLITAHDAFGYFGRAYTIEVRGLQGISTASEFGLKDLVNLVDYVVEKQVPAVFIESSVPKKSIEAIIDGCRKQGHNLQLGGQLYSDALGTPNTTEATLVGAFKANVKTIVDALTQPTP